MVLKIFKIVASGSFPFGELGRTIFFGVPVMESEGASRGGMGKEGAPKWAAEAAQRIEEIEWRGHAAAGFFPKFYGMPLEDAHFCWIGSNLSASCRRGALPRPWRRWLRS